MEGPVLLPGQPRWDIGCFHALGWQACLDAGALSSLRLASREFRAEAHHHLLAALRSSVLDAGVQPTKEMSALSRLAAVGDADSISAVASRLVDHSSIVQRAAFAALRRLTVKGDPTALSAVAAHLEQHHEGARSFATAALGRLAQRGDAEATEKVAARLADGALSVRMAATDALRRLAARGDGAVVRRVAGFLRHDDAAVREAALIALRQVVDKGDAHAISTVAEGLASPSAEVRRASVGALQHIAPRGDAVAVAAVAGRLEDRDPGVRAAAVAVLGRLAAPGDGAALAAVAARGEDADPAVRRAAVAALEHLSPEVGGDDVVSVLTACLQDREPSVRAAALLVLGRAVAAGAGGRGGDRGGGALAAGEGRVRAGEVALHFEDEDATVRVAATEALGQLIKKGNFDAISVALLLRKHAEGQAQSCAEAALERLPPRLAWLIERRWQPGGRRVIVQPRQNWPGCAAGPGGAANRGPLLRAALKCSGGGAYDEEYCVVTS